MFASLNGQQISGHVRDSSGVPVAFASVVATSCRDEQILSFASTDDKGFYQLTIATDCDSVTLTARSLGYRTEAKRLPVKNLSPVQNFTLANAVLQEIVVRGKAPPVVVRSDTTEYNVASFSDSTEFSVEDLLKKLPGAQVSESGQISLNGKLVERVLIEGDDLFNQNYHLATRNIRADMVSKIQAIERYQENPLMKGIQQSDRLVLNLKIKEDKKRSTSGSATLGSGHGDDWKGFAHTNLFSLTRRDKTYLIGNANNTGSDALGDIDYLNQGDIFDQSRQSIQSNPLQVSELIENPPMQSAGLPRAFTQANRTGFLFLGHVMPISPFFKIKMTGWVGHEQLEQTVNQRTRYLLDAASLDLTEARATERRGSVGNFQIEADYFAPDQKQSLRSFVKINGGPQRSQFDILREQPQNPPFVITQDISKNTLNGFVALEYTLKKSPNALFQLVSKNAWRDGTQTLSSDYAYYPFFFGLDSSFALLQQNARQRQGRSLFLGKYITQNRTSNWNAEAGVDWEWGRLASDVFLENAESTRWTPDSGFQNDYRLRAPEYFARLAFSKNVGALAVRLRLGASWMPLASMDEYLDIEKTASLWKLEPHFHARYELSEKTALVANYDFQQRTPEFTDYLPDFVFTDYQSAQRGLPLPVLMPGHKGGARLVFNDRQKQFSWNVGIGAGHTANQLGAQFQINPYIFLQEKYRPIVLSNYSASGSGSRFFPKLSARLGFGYNLIGLRQQNKINSEMPRDLNSQIHILSVEAGTAFDTWVNVIFSNQITHSIANNTQGQASVSLTGTNWLTSAQVVVKPPGKFDTKFYVYRIANRSNGAQYSIFYTANAVSRLRLPRWRSEARLSVVNLLNSRRFEQVFADAFFQSSTSVKAVTPFFLLSWDYRF
ncbi:MAG: carboxypeptidase regulatory-like domain-containing protein [Saprospiraceae bacterium]|nr:carboxypeptidase regulatory-like domain-containing protein [Saprospiraceae bacterium]